MQRNVPKQQPLFTARQVFFLRENWPNPAETWKVLKKHNPKVFPSYIEHTLRVPGSNGYVKEKLCTLGFAEVQALQNRKRNDILLSPTCASSFLVHIVNSSSWGQSVKNDCHHHLGRKNTEISFTQTTAHPSQVEQNMNNPIILA